MEQELIDLLKAKFNLPVKRQGSLAPNEPYPANFFTIWNNSTYDIHYYDNNETATVYDFDVNFYSNLTMNVEETLKELKKLLKENGYIVRNRYDLASDEITHIGRGMNTLYIKYLGGK